VTFGATRSSLIDGGFAYSIDSMELAECFQDGASFVG
jgi:hypothetical protein